MSTSGRSLRSTASLGVTDEAPGAEVAYDGRSLDRTATTELGDAISIVSRQRAAEECQHTEDLSHSDGSNSTIYQDRVKNVRIMTLLFLGVVSFYGVLLIVVAASITGSRLWTCPIINLPYIPAWITIATGLLMTLLGMLGVPLVTYGLTRGLFKPFSIVIGVSWAGLVIVLVLSAKYDSDVLEDKNHLFNQRITNLFVEAKSGGPEVEVGQCWDHLQRSLECCGAFGFSDWWLLGNGRRGDRLYDREKDKVGDEIGENATMVGSTEDPGWNDTSLIDEEIAGRSGSSVYDPASLPVSCHCILDSSSSPSTSAGLCNSLILINVSTNSTESISVFNRGCVNQVQTTVSHHLTVFKVLSALMLALQIIHFTVTLYASVRNNRLSSVDVYSHNGVVQPPQETVLHRIQRYVA